MLKNHLSNNLASTSLIALILISAVAAAIPIVTVNADPDSAVIEVSQPIQLTTDEHYDRNPSVFKADDGTIWLFFVRASDDLPHVPPDYNPDAAPYDVWYMTSTDGGATWSTETKIPQPTTNQRGMAAFQDDRGIIWVFTSQPGGTYINYYTYNPSTGEWTGPTSTGYTGSHVDAFQASDGKIWVFYENGGTGIEAIKSSDYGESWTHVTNIGPSPNDGIPKAMEADGKIYVVWCNWAVGGKAWYTTSTDGLTGDQWDTPQLLVDVPDTIMCDPVMIKHDGKYILFYAPWDTSTDSQWIEVITSTDLTTWFDRKRVTNGGYGATYWWDMWPEVLVGSDLYLFYGSEKNGITRGDGNIFMYKIDWDLTHDHFEAIQPAIDFASSGDSIIVHPGTYQEQLYIEHESLTLQAAESGTVIIMPPETLTTYDVTYDVPDGTKSRTFAPLIMVMSQASSVVIEGFIIDGNHELLNRGYQTPEDPIYVGVVYANSEGTVRNCEIRNFRPEPEQTDLFNNGFAIWVVGYSEVVIEGNYIHDYGWMGIVVDGITNGETVVIVDNTITGWGPTLQTGQNGIQVSRGAHVRILSNTITGNAYTGQDWWASGIIFFDAEGEVIGNVITDNQVGVDGMGDITAIYINFNNIYGNIYSGQTICAGVCNEGEGSLNALYNWWGDPEGPTIEAFPESGDAVYGDVEFTPWLTAPLMPDPDGTGVVISSRSGENEWLEFPDSNVDVYVEGSAEVYVATYESNPGAGFMGDIGNYIDVYVPDTSGLTELEIRKYYTDEEIGALGLKERSLRLYWWNGEYWVPCSDTGVNTVENYIWARIRADTTPSLGDLTGTPFGAASRWPVGGTILPVDMLSLMMPWLLIAVAIIVSTGILIMVKKHL